MFKKFIKEVIWDFFKDNAKAVILFLLINAFNIILSLVKNISNITLKVNIPIMLFIITTIAFLIFLVVSLRKKYANLAKEFEDIKNPINPNVKNFKPGDIVILRSKTDSYNPEKLAVHEILKSKIICSDSDRNLNEYIPEELLTVKETEWIFFQQKVEQQKADAENQKFIDGINGFYRY